LVFSFLLFLLLIHSYFSIDVTGSAVQSTAFVWIFLYIFTLSRVFVYEGCVNNFSYVSILILCMCFLLIALLGLEGRRVGGVQANVFAKLSLGALFFSAFFKRAWFRYLSMLACFVFILVVNSRGAFFVATVFIVLVQVAYSVSQGRMRNYQVVLFFFVVAAVVSAAMLPTFQEYLFDFVNTSESSRGLGSSVESRQHYNSFALHQIGENPIVGYGFQTRTGVDALDIVGASAHNGFLNLFLDLGLIVGISILAIYLYFVYVGFSIVKKVKSPERKRIIFSCASFLVCYLALAVFEPVYINIGSPISWGVFVAISLIGVERSNVRSNGIYSMRSLPEGE
tara:strand:- start:23411 stop:24427 length:1017 start_codon:yes stop_codon:yes gene_type:complete